MLNQFLEMPIKFEYHQPNKEQINWLKNNSIPIPINETCRIKPLRTYKEMKLKGTMDLMYVRKAILLKLNQILDLLPNEYSFLIFDAFRTKETQQALFDYVYNQQKELNPNLSPEELFSITKEFVVHPNEKSNYPVPPHNSGGAIDLTFSFHNEALDMGTDFDSITSLSNTDWFEQDFSPGMGISNNKWMEIRKNRRLIFNSMKHVGFINYKVEWWHFDLGDCMWANSHGLLWSYPSMENEIIKRY